MSGDDAETRRAEAARWLAIAQEDVRVSALCLTADPIALASSAYHCQQAAEKIAKGLLVLARMNFRRTHDLDELVDLAGPQYPDQRIDLDELRRLTLWGIAFRYPGLEDEPDRLPTAVEIEIALASIRRVATHLNVLIG